MRPILRNSYVPIIYLYSTDTTKTNKVITALVRDGFIAEVVDSFAELHSLLSKRISSVVLIDANSIAMKEAREQCCRIKSEEALNNVPFILLKEGPADNENLSVGEKDLDLIISLDEDTPAITSKIKAVVSHYRRDQDQHVLKYDDITMNLASYEVTRQNKRIKLGPTEFRILQCLMQYPHKILSRNFIMDAAWSGTKAVDSRTIDVHINRLRNALKLHKDELPLIETIRSLGYCLRKG